MPLVDLLHLGSSAWPEIAWRMAWQSTAILATALLAARLIPMRPSRAHRLLLAAAIACLVVPAASLAARRLDVGLFRAATPTPTSPRSVPALPPQIATRIDVPDRVDRRAVVPDSAPAEIAAAPASPPREAFSWQPRPDGSIFAAAWAIAAAVGLARLLASFAAAARIRARSRPIADRDVLAAADAAARYLGLSIAPLVRSSADVHCPVVWCWARRPVLIVPDQAETWDDERLAAILCHELAHWLRADHASALIAELLTCLLPWQPLAWRLRSRMADLAELACDDWALAHARSVSPDDYVEALLGLATNRRRPLVPAAVSSRAGLVARARHILEEGCSMPRTGRLWNALIAATCVGLITLLALAQTRQVKALAAAKGKSGRETTIEGVVRDDRGKPVPGAEVVWIGPGEFLLDYVAPPLGSPDAGDVRKAVATGISDAQGRFTLSAPVYKPGRNSPWSTVVAHKTGLAPGSLEVPRDGKPIEILLKPAVPIVGRLVTPAGDPAAGVVVRLGGYSDGSHADRRSVWMELNGAQWDGRPAFFPGDFRTDASGRFVIDGLVPAGVFATISLRPANYAPEELTVSTREADEPTEDLKASRPRTVPREFLHTLASARPVVGTVIDEVTRQPLAGVKVGVCPMREGSGTPIYTTTDEHGRYRVVDREAEEYSVTADPTPDSGFLNTRKDVTPRGAAGSEVKIDLALPRGSLIKGRVVDDKSGAPLRDVTIFYQPTASSESDPRNRPNLQTAMATDARGRFAITGVPGPGVIAADASGRGFVRFDTRPVMIFHQMTHYVHGFAQVDVPEVGNGSLDELVIKLRKGKTLDVRTVRPDGSAAGNVRGWCPELSPRPFESWLRAEPQSDGAFRLSGADPGRTYRVLFLSEDETLGAAAELKADPDREGPIVVTLQPTASIRGRVLGLDGKPRKAGRSMFDFILTNITHPNGHDPEDFAFEVYTGNPLAGRPKEEIASDFRYAGLIPGVRYYLRWSVTDIDNSWKTVEALKPGEDRDLGEIRSVKKEGPDVD